MTPQLQDAVTLAEDLKDMPAPTITEVALEIEINDACHELALTPDEAEQRALFDRVQELHRRRTPVQVARMERERGLSR